MATVSLLVRLRDEASKGLQRIADKVTALATKKVKLGEAFRFTTRAAALFTAGIAAAATGVALLARRGAEVIGVQRAFARVTGDSQGALRGLRQATQGLLSDYELMTGLNRALTLGSAKNSEQFGELAKTAIALGRALGIDAGFALESLNTGIARQSRLFLDNIGIVLSVEDANRAYARTLGVQASALTDTQKREAFRVAALEAARQKIAALGGTVESAGDKVTRLGVAFKNARDQISKLVATSPFVNELFGKLATLGTDIATILHGSGDQIAATFRDLGAIAANAFSVGVMEGWRAITPDIFERMTFGFQERVSRAAQENIGALMRRIGARAGQVTDKGRVDAGIAGILGLGGGPRRGTAAPIDTEAILRDRLSGVGLATSMRNPLRLRGQTFAEMVQIAEDRERLRRERGPLMADLPDMPRGRESVDRIGSLSGRLAGGSALLASLVGAGRGGGVGQVISSAGAFATQFPGLQVPGVIAGALGNVFSLFDNSEERRHKELLETLKETLRPLAFPERISLNIVGDPRSAIPGADRATRRDAIDRSASRS